MTGTFSKNNTDYTQEDAQFVDMMAALPSSQLIVAQQMADHLHFKNTNDFLQFGLPIQQEASQLSNQMLQMMRRKDIEKVTTILNQLVEKLSDIHLDDLKREKQTFLQKVFGKTPPSLQQTLTQFQRLFVQVDRLYVQLQTAHQHMRDELQQLNQLQVTNQQCLDDVLVYTCALHLKKQQLLLAEEQPALDHFDLYHDDTLTATLERLNQRQYDLELSKQLLLQTSWQLQLLKKNHEQLIEKIQTTIFTTIPLWKNQMTYLFSMQKEIHATKLEQQWLSSTKDFVEKNKEMTAHFANEQQSFSLNTLQQTQDTLLQMVEDTLQLEGANQTAFQQDSPK